MHFQKLMEERLKIDSKDKSSETKLKKAIWQDRLAELFSRFKIDEFVALVSDIDPNHPNMDVMVRLVEILNLIRQDTQMHDNGNFLVLSSRMGRSDPTSAAITPKSGRKNDKSEEKIGTDQFNERGASMRSAF